MKKTFILMVFIGIFNTANAFADCRDKNDNLVEVNDRITIKGENGNIRRVLDIQVRGTDFYMIVADFNSVGKYYDPIRNAWLGEVSCSKTLFSKIREPKQSPIPCSARTSAPVDEEKLEAARVATRLWFETHDRFGNPIRHVYR